MMNRTITIGLMLLMPILLSAGDVVAQRRGGNRGQGTARRQPTRTAAARGPSLPAPFHNLNAAQTIQMSRVGQLSVDWLAGIAPQVDDVDPVVDLFGPYGGRRATTEEGEELPENEWGLVVLSGLEGKQRRLLYDLTIKQQNEHAQYVALRKRLLAKLNTLRGTTKVDRNFDREVLELGGQLGQVEASLAFAQAVTFADLGRTLTDNQKAFLTRLRADPRLFDPQADNVMNMREGVAKVDANLQLPLLDLAAKAGSFLTGTAVDNTKNVPKRLDLLGETNRREGDHVVSFLKSVNATQYEEYGDLLRGETALLASISAKRLQMLELLDQQKRTRSTNDAKLKALAKTSGEIEARLALLRVRSFEQFRRSLTEDQKAILRQAAG